ncbi:hypothetical protein HWV62_33789 [Athelia sp. TMB]|nr:hypothetical protein HWV62_33789 [Athelia sp. TMB]
MSELSIAFNCHILPPTVNRLNTVQRTRLIKSTDKLARVLGTTPHVLEEHQSPFAPKGKGIKKGVKAIRRQGGLYGGYASSSSNDSCLGATNSSVESLSSSSEAEEPSLPSLPAFPNKGKRGKKIPPPLFIRLNTVPVSPSDARFGSSTPLSSNPSTCTSPTTPSTLTPRSRSTRTSRSRTASTPTKSAHTSRIRSRARSKAAPRCDFPPTPCTPVFTSTEIKRKRLAKLARHLGEHVPAHLVLGPARQPSLVGPPSVRGKRDLGVPVMQESRRAAAGKRVPSWTGEWNRTDMRDVQRQLRALKL